jgi:hypothetical protein
VPHQGTPTPTPHAVIPPSNPHASCGVAPSRNPNSRSRWCSATALRQCSHQGPSHTIGLLSVPLEFVCSGKCRLPWSVLRDVLGDRCAATSSNQHRHHASVSEEVCCFGSGAGTRCEEELLLRLGRCPFRAGCAGVGGGWRRVGCGGLLQDAL